MFELWQAIRLWPVYSWLGVQDVKLRFRRAALGPLWVFLHLGLSIATIGVVFGAIFGEPLRAFLPFIAAGLIVWNFLVSAVIEGGAALLNAEGYIKQIGLPIHVYCLRAVVSITLALLLSLPVFAVVALVSGLTPGPGVVWVVPGVALLIGFATTVSLLLSFLVVRFRELSQVLPAGMQVLFYATPVIYPPEVLAQRGLDWVVRLNPLHHFVEVVRQPLLHSRPAEFGSYAAALGSIAVLFVLGAVAARWLRPRVAYLL